MPTKSQPDRSHWPFEARDFFDLVCAMRDAQRKYFKTRDAIHLSDAKDAERMVDRAIVEILGEPNVPR